MNCRGIAAQGQTKFRLELCNKYSISKPTLSNEKKSSLTRSIKAAVVLLIGAIHAYIII